MELLMDHTLQRQLAQMQKLAERASAQSAQLATQSAQIAELTALLKGQLVLSGASPSSTTVNGPVQTLDQSMTQIAQLTQVENLTQVALTQINIHPWDGDDRISVPVSLIAAAFTENPRLAEFCCMDDNAKSDPETASPYITEALVDLTRRAHADPATRNIYLNPKRADQVMVCLRSGDWEVRALNNASQGLFDGVAESIHRVMISQRERMQLPMSIQASACYVPMLYREDPERYVRSAKGALSAHLANMAPKSLAPGQHRPAH
jgi:hypothetical protein